MIRRFFLLQIILPVILESIEGHGLGYENEWNLKHPHVVGDDLMYRLKIADVCGLFAITKFIVINYRYFVYHSIPQINSYRLSY